MQSIYTIVRTLQAEQSQAINAGDTGLAHELAVTIAKLTNQLRDLSRGDI